VKRFLRSLIRIVRREQVPPAPSGEAGPPEPEPSSIDIRITAGLFASVRAHVEDFSRGEEAGFLLCSVSRGERCDHLLAREFVPVPEEALERFTDGSVLSWSAEFNSEVLQRAVDLDAVPVLVHSHGEDVAGFSGDDRRRELPLFSAFSRILAPSPTGTVVFGGVFADGSFWSRGYRSHIFRRVLIIGEALEVRWSPAEARRELPLRERLDRQNVAIPNSDAALARATVAVIGLSGGGSHVVQQLAHLGIGRLIVVDNELVERTNLGRLVGATEADIDVTLKTDLAERVASGIDSSIEVIKVQHRFPSPEAISALKDADIVVTALDTFRAREMVNRFCRRHLIPQIDIGMVIKTKKERLTLASGQVVASIPGFACLRCWFLDNDTLNEEAREKPPGYDRDPNAPGDPQVVSMNGTLASEACNCVLDMITGYSGSRRGAKVWRYDGRAGNLEQGDMPSRRSSCDACAEQGLGERI
jgi:molybdopterin/thiamine biosynthesis adenylyltransferase